MLPLRYPPARVVSDEEPTNEALMAAYLAGDEAAFRALFERYVPTLLRLGRRHLSGEAQAQELVQHTFMRLHGARRDFDKRSRVHPWLMTIAMNYVRDQWRARKRRPPEETLDNVRGPVATDDDPGKLEQKERAATVRRALSQLPENYREVLELYWFQDRSFAEIAEILGTTAGAARVRAHRASARLKDIIAAEVGNV
ncbi:MAG: sigma-70 family RNA polymerase sigma factor [Myxococcales bacterium]|nr:sigma-70 family RNA polymerase sigma factor [Myxococcales bacterium]